jgi:hypothetical protein
MKVRQKKKRRSPELHWGYNYSKSNIPVVPGSGQVGQGIFNRDEKATRRMPKVHLGIAFALAGAVILTLGFLLSPFLLIFIVPLVLRGFSQTPDWEALSINR